MSIISSSPTLRKAKAKLSKCSACEEGQGVCAHLLVVVSVLLIFLTMPFSLCLVVKVVQVLHCLSSSFSLYLSSSSSFYLSSSSSLYMPSSFSLYFSSSSSCIYPPRLPDSLATTLKSLEALPKSECYFPTPELCNLGSNLWRHHIASSLSYCNSGSTLHILVPMSC